MRITTKRLIFLGYFLGTFLLRMLSGGVFRLIQELVLWFAGALLGGYLIKIEQLIYAYFIHPLEPLSLEIKELLKENPTSAWQLLREKVIDQKLAFRSVLFQVSWVVLAFFTLTSTNSVFGKTLVMAIGLHLLLDEWEDVLGKKGLFWLFWQIKREVGIGEQKWFVWVMTGIFGVLSLLLI